MFIKKNSQSYHKHYKIKQHVIYNQSNVLTVAVFLFFVVVNLECASKPYESSFVFDQTLSYSNNESYVFNYGSFYNYDEELLKPEQPLDYEAETLVNLNQPYFRSSEDLLKSYCDNSLCQEGVFKWHESKRKKLYVGGIFPMVGGWPGGQACLPSAIMALNEVNLNTKVLPGYKLVLNWFNSEVIFFYYSE